MTNKTFVNLSREECKKECYVLFSNSRIKWESATKLAQMGEDYGTAISLCIISIEELIKGIVLFLDGQGFEFRNVKGIKSILYKDHQIRYFIAFAMFVISIVGEDMINTFRRFMTDVDFRETTMKQFNEKDRSLETRVKLYVLKRLVMLRKEFSWFEKINKFRQNGFYTGYSGSLTSPQSITKRDYRELHKRLYGIYKLGHTLMADTTTQIADIEKETYKTIIKKFKEDDGYKKIEVALSALAKSKKDPFAFAREQLNK